MPNIPIIHLYNTILPIMQEVESSLKLKQLKAIAIVALKLLRRKSIKLIVDCSLMPVASLYRARTQKIRRSAGRQFWG
jgi:hypothetical protein